MYKLLIGTGIGFILSKFINKSKKWYIKKNNKFVQLEVSSIVTYLHNDYLNSKENTQYEFLDFVVDFEKLRINYDDQWYDLYFY